LIVGKKSGGHVLLRNTFRPSAQYMAAQKAQTKLIRKECAKALPTTHTCTHELYLNFCSQNSYDSAGYYYPSKEHTSCFDRVLFFYNTYPSLIAYSGAPLREMWAINRHSRLLFIENNMSVKGIVRRKPLLRILRQPDELISGLFGFYSVLGG